MVQKGGFIMIFIFIILILIPYIHVLITGKFKKFSLLYGIIYFLFTTLFINQMIHSYFRGKRLSANKHDKAVYKLFSEGGWTNFRIWYAALANEVWMDIIFVIMLFLIPSPFFSIKYNNRF